LVIELTSIGSLAGSDGASARRAGGESTLKVLSPLKFASGATVDRTRTAGLHAEIATTAAAQMSNVA
jgi:hypothetical protein